MDDQEEQRQQEKSSVDRANDVIGKGRNVYNRARQLRSVYKRVKAARTAVTAGEVALATSEIWVPILLLFLIFLLLATLIIVIFGGTQNTNAENLTSCTNISGAVCQTKGQLCPNGTSADTSGAYYCADSTKFCCLPPISTNIFCDPNNPRLSLQQNFNISATGFTNSQLMEICESFATAGKSSTYLSLLRRAGPISMSIANLSFCGMRVPSLGTILVDDKWFTCGYSKTFRQATYIHESGHLIAAKFGRLYQLFNSFAYYPRDPSCYFYYSGKSPHWYLLTYAASYVNGGGGGLSESFAESMMQYVFSINQLKNYKYQCPVGYNWEKTNIFGGYEF